MSSVRATATLLADARRVAGGPVVTTPAVARTVVVAGVGDVAGVIEACAVIDPRIELRRGLDGESQRASGALMVLDPASALDEGEREIYARLRAEVGTVGLVCTAIEAFWEWPRALRSHRAILDPAEEFPVFAVSPAAVFGGAVDESGMGELLEWLAEVVGAPDALRAERASVGAALAALDGQPIRRRAAAGMQPESMAALVARRRMLVAARDRGRTDQLTAVRTGLAAIRSAAAGQTHAGIRQVAATMTRRTAHVDHSQLAEHADWLAAEIINTATIIEEELELRLAELADKALLGVLDHQPASPVSAAAVPDGPGGSRGQVSIPPLADVAAAARRGVPSGRRGVEDGLLVVLGASTGLGIGRLVVAPLAAVHTVQWISMPITLLLGVAVAVWLIRARRGAARRAELRNWSTDVLAEARGRLEHRISGRIAEAEARLVGRIGRYHDRQTRRLAARIAETDEELRRYRSGRSSGGAAESARLRAELAVRLGELWADGPAAHKLAGATVSKESADGPVCAG